MNTESNIFIGPREKWLPLYQDLKTQTEAMLGEFTEHSTTGAILWKHHTSFTGISTKINALVVSFASDNKHPEWNADKTIQTSPHRISYFFEITDDSTFPLLLERIKLAFELTKQNPVRKLPEQSGEYHTVEEYIALYPVEIQQIMQKVRNIIKSSAPLATEKISWQMPTYYQNENLVHFAAFKNHLGFYPSPEGILHFAKELSAYSTTKGAVQFPYALPIPYDLIAKITKYRVKAATLN